MSLSYSLSGFLLGVLLENLEYMPDLISDL